MFRTIASNVWAFDLEWVPCPESGRRVYDLPADMADDDVRRVMWGRGGASEEEPQPFLKYALCRVCLLYTSDAADERSSVDLGGRRIIKKNTN